MQLIFKVTYLNIAGFLMKLNRAEPDEYQDGRTLRKTKGQLD